MRQILHIAFIIFFVIATNTSSYAEDYTLKNSSAIHNTYAVYTDSVAYTRPLFYGERQQRLDRLTNKNWFKMTSVAVPLIIGGITLEHAKHPINDLRNAYIPTFRKKYDDYLQYSPAVLMLGLKAFGYKSYSSWGRMLTADAFTVAIMATLTNGLKYTVKSQRPNSGSHNSFPSGHTATAFMTATMLHKEYGQRSPWISVTGYTIATATAYSRLLNNRHWISDVLVGAGIGIISTEMAYWITDLIFKDKGLRHTQYDYNTTFPDRTPSFVGLYTGFTFMPKNLKISEDLQFTTSAGASSGIEGAWFINDYIGIGGQAIVGHVPTQLKLNAGQSMQNLTAVDDGVDIVSASVGGYFICPLSYRWSVGSKLLAGYAFSDAQTLYITDEDDNQLPYLKLKEMHMPDFQTGVSVSYWAKLNMGFRFFFDYTLTPAQYQYHFVEKPGVIHQANKCLSSMTLGASVNILL